MIRTLPLLFLAAAAAEIASIIWVGKLIGIVPTLLMMMLGGVIGVRLIKSAGTGIVAALRSPVQSASPLKGLGGLAAAQTASGLLFLLPGFFSDAVALLLFLPGMRRWIGQRFVVETYSTPPAGQRRYDQIIEAEAVEISGDIEPPDRPRR